MWTFAKHQFWRWKFFHFVSNGRHLRWVGNSESLICENLLKDELLKQNYSFYFEFFSTLTFQFSLFAQCTALLLFTKWLANEVQSRKWPSSTLFIYSIGTNGLTDKFTDVSPLLIAPTDKLIGTGVISDDLFLYEFYLNQTIQSIQWPHQLLILSALHC